MMKTVVSLIFLVSAASATFSDCGSVAGEVQSVNISGCDIKAPVCILKKGNTVTFAITFKATAPSNSLTASVHGVIGGVPLPFPLPQTDACQNSGITCPLVAGQVYNYSTSLDVLESYPSLDVTVKWELMDEDKKDAVCIEVPAELQ